MSATTLAFEQAVLGGLIKAPMSLQKAFPTTLVRIFTSATADDTKEDVEETQHDDILLKKRKKKKTRRGPPTYQLVVAHLPPVMMPDFWVQARMTAADVDLLLSMVTAPTCWMLFMVYSQDGTITTSTIKPSHSTTADVLVSCKSTAVKRLLAMLVNTHLNRLATNSSNRLQSITVGPCVLPPMLTYYSSSNISMIKRHIVMVPDDRQHTVFDFGNGPNQLWLAREVCNDTHVRCTLMVPKVSKRVRGFSIPVPLPPHPMVVKVHPSLVVRIDVEPRATVAGNGGEPYKPGDPPVIYILLHHDVVLTS